MVHHDLWDLDPNSAPQLTTIRQNGRNRDVVAVAGKTGWLYVFDRVTGDPIWPIEERPVPKSEMPGEVSWPTQPYPTNPPPFIKQTFTVEDISPYLAAAEAETFRQRLLAANNKGMFTPISYADTVHVPTNNGGSLFGGTATEPGPAQSTLSHTRIRASCTWCVPTQTRGVAVVVRLRQPGRLSISRIASHAMAQNASAQKAVRRRLSMQLPTRRTTSWPARRASMRQQSARSLVLAKGGCPHCRT